MKAKKRIVDSLGSDTNLAKWYMERRSLLEYGNKAQIEGNHSHGLDSQLLESIKEQSRSIDVEHEVL